MHQIVVIQLKRRIQKRKIKLKYEIEMAVKKRQYIFFTHGDVKARKKEKRLLMGEVSGP